MIRAMRIFEKMHQRNLSLIQVREDHYDNLREKKYFSLEKARTLRMKVVSPLAIAIHLFINITIVTIVTIMVV